MPTYTQTARGLQRGAPRIACITMTSVFIFPRGPLETLRSSRTCVMDMSGACVPMVLVWRVQNACCTLFVSCGPCACRTRMAIPHDIHDMCFRCFPTKLARTTHRLHSTNTPIRTIAAAATACTVSTRIRRPSDAHPTLIRRPSDAHPTPVIYKGSVIFGLH